jgi:hypothetical protein
MARVTQELLFQRLSQRLVDSDFGAATPARARCEAIVVLKDFALGDYVAGVRQFVARVPEAQRRDWYRRFTPTLFLAGDPARLQERFRFDHVDERGAVAWLFVPDAERDHDLKRLLKILRTELPYRAADGPVRIASGAGSPARWRLLLAMSGLRLERVLVHLNHTLVEAQLSGLLAATDGIEILHVDAIDEIPDSARYLRIHADEADPQRLRLYAMLVERADG